MPGNNEREKLVLRLVLAKIIIRTLCEAMANSSSLSEEDFERLREAQKLDRILVASANVSPVLIRAIKKLARSTLIPSGKTSISEPALNLEPVTEIITSEEISSLENFNQSPDCG